MVLATVVKRVLAYLVWVSTVGTVVTPAVSQAVDCDTRPTRIETTDYFLPFEVPTGLMPDPQFDGLPAHLEVHRVRPVYTEKCPSLTTSSGPHSRPHGHRPCGVRSAVSSTRWRHA